MPRGLAMTSVRYRAYRELLQTLDSLSLRDVERDFLRDAAEGFLLASDDADEPAELGLGSSIVLDRAVSARRITRQAADELMGAIEACGPEGTVLLAA